MITKINDLFMRKISAARGRLVLTIVFSHLSLLTSHLFIFLFIFFPLTSFLFSSCTSIDCTVENTVSVQYEILDKEGEAWAISDSLSVVSTRLDGQNILLDITTLLNGKYNVLNKLTGYSSFSLPISYSHPEDVLYFCFTDEVKTVVDTVWIKKNDIPHFESVDCSASFFHELTDVRYTSHAIDSLVLINPSVTYDASTVHFRLYPKAGN